MWFHQYPLERSVANIMTNYRVIALFNVICKPFTRISFSRFTLKTEKWRTEQFLSYWCNLVKTHIWVSNLKFTVQFNNLVWFIRCSIITKNKTIAIMRMESSALESIFYRKSLSQLNISKGRRTWKEIYLFYFFLIWN